MIAMIALAICGCSSSPVTLPSPSPGFPCQSAGLREAQSLGRNARLAAAFVSNVADVASWESHAYGGSMRILNSSYSGAPLDRVDVCYFDGAFTIGSHPLATAGATFHPYDLLLVTVNADGVARIATAGFRETTPLASPAHGP